jgi:hypothetical protein
MYDIEHGEIGEVEWEGLEEGWMGEQAWCSIMCTMELPVKIGMSNCLNSWKSLEAFVLFS